MTQNASDVEIANQGFAAFRQDLNDVLEDITTLHSGDTAPSTTYANQLWYEEDTDTLYIRNEDNDAWIDLAQLDQTNDDATLIGDIKRKAASGTDVAGTDLTIQGGAGTGTGAGGKIVFQTADGGSTGSTVNSYATAMEVLDDGSIDIQGNELILDADGDTSITADTDDQIDFKTGGSDRMVIDNIGKVGIGKTSVDSDCGRLQVNSSDANTVKINGTGTRNLYSYHDSGGVGWATGSDSNWGNLLYLQESSNAIALYTNGSQRLFITGTGAVLIDESSGSGYLSVQQAYNGTTSSAANMHIFSNGNFLRSVSSGKYKTGVEDAEMSYAEELYNLRPVYYKSLGTFDNPNHGHWGFIAEEVAEIDPRLCIFRTTEPDLDDDGNIQRDDDGNIIERTLDEPVVEGVQYDRMIPLLLKLLKAEKDKVETLEAKVATLETQATDFETRIAALESA